MLQSLTIKNIALIDSLTIELGVGLNVLTGETGAGKSLIIDSLSLLLGEKADRGLISYGENFASVEAVFHTELEEVLNKLEEFGLERENTIIISRKLSQDGKNECRVNGKAFTLSMLKCITAPLMDLHGQFQHQEILKETNQLKTLDDFGGEQIKQAKKDYKEQYYKLKEINKKLSGYNFDSRDREKLLDLYNFQINEIEEANFISGEEEKLKDFRMKVLNQEKIAMGLSRVCGMFDGSGESMGISDLLKRCDYEFSEIAKYMPEQEDLTNRLASARYELQDIAECMESLKDNLCFDEFEAEANEKRLDLLSSLKKKYGSNIDEINLYLKYIKSEYEKLVNSAEIIEKLTSEKTQIIANLKEKAAILSGLRKKVATTFEQRVLSELAELSMKNSSFKIDFVFGNEESADETGFDKIEFMFTANAGQPLRPLNKVASGGEMSRFMLSVKNITADSDRVDTMIFDEIDTGISGDTANVLAEKLSSTSKSHQIICVTHLAQVASFGDNHFYISKSTENEKTRTTLKLLSEEERVYEIARIIGGSISDFSLSHAKLMLENGKKF